MASAYSAIQPGRNNSLNAYRTAEKKEPTIFGTVSVGSDAAYLGGKAIDLSQGSIAIRGAVYNGPLYFPQTQAWTLVLRIRSDVSSTSGNNIGVLALCTSVGSANCPYAIYYWWATDSTLRWQLITAGGSNLGSGSLGAWDGSVIDLVMTSTGASGAAGLNVYIDEVVKASINMGGAAWPFPREQGNPNVVALGQGNGFRSTRILVEELATFEGVQDISNMEMSDGTFGALNGAARTKFLHAVEFEGAAYTDPGESNVRLNQAYTFNGLAKTGTAAIPAAADVRFGTAIDNTTGLLNLPAEADVRLGVSYDSATKTGTYSPSIDYPAEDDVRDGVEYGDGTLEGTLDLPLASNVRAGTTFDGGTQGTLVTTPDKLSITVDESESVTITVEG